jgi:predicted ester cyclase
MAPSNPDLEANKQFVRDHFEEFVNRKNSAIAYRNFTPDFLDHGGPYSETTGQEATKRMMDGMYAQYPDLSVTIEDIFAEGDRVVARNIWRGTDATTGKRMSFEGIVIWRFAHGRLAERWARIEPPREDAL